MQQTADGFLTRVVSSSYSGFTLTNLFRPYSIDVYGKSWYASTSGEPTRMSHFEVTMSRLMWSLHLDPALGCRLLWTCTTTSRDYRGFSRVPVWDPIRLFLPFHEAFIYQFWYHMERTWRVHKVTSPLQVLKVVTTKQQRWFYRPQASIMHQTQ